MPHNFWKSLEYEGRKTQLADQFYYHTFGIESHTRFDTGSDFDMEFQRMDIDVQLNAWGRHANVSEKFRDRDFGDLYLEVYSMFPNSKGWTEVEGADYLAYFFPLRMLWIKKSDLKKFYCEHVAPRISDKRIEKWIEENGAKSGRIKPERPEEYELVIAYNRVRNKDWHTIGVTVDFDFLKKHGLTWKEYRL